MTLSQSILATLAYHDIFDYPLILKEIHKYLVNIEASPFSVRAGLNRLFLSGKIFSKSGYIFLESRSKIVEKRIQRKRISSRKFQRAVFFSNILKANPFIKTVGVTGALAMDNSDQKDDIDLFLITTKDFIWTARFFSNLFMIPFKRSPVSKITKNKACLNIFIDESHLKIEPPNIYLAHEICQMKPLWDRDGTYRRFISANKWIKNFLPNWKPETVVNGQWKMVNSRSKKSIYSLFTIYYSPIENFLRSFQLWYMRPKITTEKIGDTQLFFHPADTQEWVMEKYKRRLRKLRIASS